MESQKKHKDSQSHLQDNLIKEEPSEELVEPQKEEQEAEDTDAKQESNQEFEKIYEQNYAIEDVYTSFNKLNDKDDLDYIDPRFDNDKDDSEKQNELTQLNNNTEKNFAEENSAKNLNKLEDILKANMKKEEPKPRILVTNDWINDSDTL